jgi:hypothetical protein
MRHLKRIFLCLAASLLMVVACAAQQKARTKKSSKHDPPPPVLVPGPGKLLVPTAVRHVGSATVQYIGAIDKTSVYVELPRVYRSQGLWLDLYCGFDVPGKDVVTPETIDLSLDWDTNVFRKEIRLFRKGGVVVFEADGRRFEFEAEQSCFSDEVEKCDHTVAHMDLDSFRQILNGRVVRVQAEPHAFELREKELDALRDLLKAIESPAK